MRRKHTPLRRCIVCGQQRPKHEFLRLVRTPTGRLEVDADPKASGRGAYVCRSEDCLRKAAYGRAVMRSLKVSLSEEDAAALLERAGRADLDKMDARR